MDLSTHAEKLRSLKEALQDESIYGEGRLVHEMGARIRDGITHRLKSLEVFQEDPYVADYKPQIDAVIDHLHRQRALADALHALGPIPDGTRLPAQKD
jgi:hypothetical protein